MLRNCVKGVRRICESLAVSAALAGMSAAGPAAAADDFGGADYYAGAGGASYESDFSAGEALDSDSVQDTAVEGDGPLYYSASRSHDLQSNVSLGCPHCGGQHQCSKSSCGQGGCRGNCACGCCSKKKQEELAKAAATAYKDPFYNNNFNYLNDPCYDDWRPGQRLKRMEIGDAATVDLGGEYRMRLHNENNMRGLRLTNRDDDFLLHRTRLFANAEIGERFRAYAEYLDAVSNYEEFAPRLIEENRSDFLNLFGDLVVAEGCDAKLTARVGRQELLYGDQRLISPLDWANTRRTFDGAKLMLETENWNVDGFWTRPVIVDPIHFDSPDPEQEFYALWSTYKGWSQTQLDLYWIGYADYDAPYAAADQFHYQTVGARCLPTRGDWMGLLQGGYQFGSFGDQGHSAGFFVTGVGRKFECVAWKPVCWIYYDWASGDDTIGNGYHHLFPLGHKYFGFMDFFARSNIEDINVQVTASPHAKVNLLLWWHCLFLQNSNDVPYTVTMQPVVNTPGGDSYLGQELDLLANWNITPYFSVGCGYSHFFTGDWYRTNPVARNGFTGDADFVYTYATLRF